MGGGGRRVRAYRQHTPAPISVRRSLLRGRAGSGTRTHGHGHGHRPSLDLQSVPVPELALHTSQSSTTLNSLKERVKSSRWHSLIIHHSIKCCLHTMQCPPGHERCMGGSPYRLVVELTHRNRRQSRHRRGDHPGHRTRTPPCQSARQAASPAPHVPLRRTAAPAVPRSSSPR